MKKLRLLSLMLIVCMLFTACQASGGKENNVNGNVAGNVGENQDSDNSENGDDKETGESTENMIWFPKSATCSSEDGNTNVKIETTLEDGKLIYHYISYGVNTFYNVEYENTMGFEVEFDDNSITAMYDIREYASGIEKTQIVLEYDEANNVYIEKEVDVETGEYGGYTKYEVTFDDEGKVLTRTDTYIERNKPDGEWVEEAYDPSITKFEYAEDGYYVIDEWNPTEYTLASGEEADCIKRMKKFIPYDSSQNYVEQITFHLTDGTQVCVSGYDDFYDIYADNTKMTEYIYNSKGYLIEGKSHLGDGQIVPIDFGNTFEATYDETGNILTYVYYYDGEVDKKGTYTYDENGNLTHIEMYFDEMNYVADIEWMLVPDVLVANRMFPYGDSFYAISELIEDTIPERFWTDRANYVYTKEDLASILNGMK